MEPGLVCENHFPFWKLFKTKRRVKQTFKTSTGKALTFTAEAN